MIDIQTGPFQTGAIDKDQKLYTWGDNTNFSLFSEEPDRPLIHTPLQVLKELSIKSAFLGNTHSFAISLTSEVLACGKFGEGQIPGVTLQNFHKNHHLILAPGQNDKISITRIDGLLGEVKDIKAGNDFTFILYGRAQDA